MHAQKGLHLWLLCNSVHDRFITQLHLSCVHKWLCGVIYLYSCAGHTALDKPMLYGTLPITKTVAAALGAVIAVLVVALVGVAVGWRLSITRSRKSYKKWNEEVCSCCLFPQLLLVLPCLSLHLCVDSESALRRLTLTSDWTAIWLATCSRPDKGLSGHLQGVHVSSPELQSSEVLLACTVSWGVP